MHLTDWAKDAANNHARFTSFAWFDAPEDRANWTIHYTHNRDSGLLDQSNASVIAETLQPFDNDVRSADANHWACGWVDGFAVRVYRADGTITEAANALFQIVAALADYPVLDEDDLSHREFDAALENIAQIGRNDVSARAPKCWPGKVAHWLDANMAGEMEDSDGQGAYPSRESVLSALAVLRHLSRNGREAFRAAGL